MRWHSCTAVRVQAVAGLHEDQLQVQVSNVFAGKHGFITPRDLFKWAGRGAVGYQQLAENGYLLLAERLRAHEDRAVVRKALEKQLKVQVVLQACALLLFFLLLLI